MIIFHSCVKLPESNTWKTSLSWLSWNYHSIFLGFPEFVYLKLFFSCGFPRFSMVFRIFLGFSPGFSPFSTPTRSNRPPSSARCAISEARSKAPSSAASSKAAWEKPGRSSWEISWDNHIVYGITMVRYLTYISHDLICLIVYGRYITIVIKPIRNHPQYCYKWIYPLVN